MTPDTRKKTILWKKWLAASWPLLLAIAVRIVYGVLTGLWFSPGNLDDDVLMFEYASVRHHFTEPNMFSLAKYMGYPFFIAVTRLSGLPLSVVLSAVWSAAALLMYKLVYEIARKRWIALILFFYVLFLPVAFEQSAGLRIYRNQILAPFTVLTLGLAALLVVRTYRIARPKRFIFPALMLGTVFSFTYYVKEDGIWILACLIFADAVMIALALRRIVRKRKENGEAKRMKHVLSALVVAIVAPLSVFLIVTAGYRAVNARFFGVASTETRTHGETGEFVKKIYQIDSEERTGKIWTPLDAIDQAFQASETLRNASDLYEALMTNPFSDGNLRETPLPGDVLTWAIRAAINETMDTWDEAKVQAFFRTVNDELDEAFRSGTLKRSDRIQLFPSAGGYTLKEIGDVFAYTLQSFTTSLWLDGYRSGIIPDDEGPLVHRMTAAEYTHMDSIADPAPYQRVRDVMRAVNQVLFVIYGVLNTVGLAIVAASPVLMLVKKRARVFGGEQTVKQWAIGREHDGSVPLFMALVFFLLVAFAYAFAISWFSSAFMIRGGGTQWLTYYTVSLPAIQCFVFGCGLMIFLKNLPKRRSRWIT